MENNQVISKDELYRKMLQNSEKEAGMPIGICIDDSFSMWKYKKYIENEIEQLLKRIRGNTIYEESVYLSFRIVNQEVKSVPFKAAKYVNGCPELHPRGSSDVEVLLDNGIDMMDLFDPSKQRAEPILVLITDGKDQDPDFEWLQELKERLDERDYRLILAVPDFQSVAGSVLFRELKLNENDVAYYYGESKSGLAMTLFECIKRNSESTEMGTDWEDEEDDDNFGDYLNQRNSGFTEEMVDD